MSRFKDFTNDYGMTVLLCALVVAIIGSLLGALHIVSNATLQYLWVPLQIVGVIYLITLVPSMLKRERDRRRRRRS